MRVEVGESGLGRSAVTEQLILVAVLTLVSYTTGYLMGRADGRRVKRRGSILIARAREREWQRMLGEPGSPKMN